MLHFIKIITIFIFYIFAGNVHANINETAKVDLLLMQAKKAYDQQDYQKTISTIEKALNTKVAIPESVYYVYADSLNQIGEYQEAKVWLEKYINQAGREGVFYSQALESLMSIDDKVQVKVQQQNVNQDFEANIKTFLDNFVAIPTGTFLMGSNSGAWSKVTKPVHKVNVAPFKLMKTEITWEMYQPCIDAGECPDNAKKSKKKSWQKGKYPVNTVSWNDINNYYIPWLKNRTGEAFRLPTEAEWEYAARSGSTSKYSWGNKASCSKAQYGNDNGVCGNEDKPKPVGSFPPNAFGLYDMHGNVWELVQDCWNPNYNGAPNDSKAWMQGQCDKVVKRGGYYKNISSMIQSSHRISSYRSSPSGFRLAQDIKK